LLGDSSACRCGFGDSCDIDVRKKPSGEPFLVFSGGAEKLANERGVRNALITLSHSDQHAVATIVLES
jgi:phosphopantetheinyl transferase (holo-ACP synthase)